MNFPLARNERILQLQGKALYKVVRSPLMPSLYRRRLQCYLGIMCGDIVALVAGFALAGQVRLGAQGVGMAMGLVQLLIPIFLTVGLSNTSYSIKALGRSSYAVGRVMLTLAVSSALLVFISFFARTFGDFSRLLFSSGVVLSALMLVVVRLQMARFVRWRCGAHVLNELVIHDGGPDVNMPNAYHVAAADFGLKPVLDDPRALDRIGMVFRNADRVIVSTPAERREAWAIILKGANVSGEVIDETVAQLSAQGARLVCGQGLLQVSVGPLGMRDRVVKRLLDVSVAGLALLALAPLMLLVALAIRLEDGGPVFFIQRRVGRGNRFFPILKFRSMTVNKAGKNGGQSASKTDQRVTRIGRLIRSTSIDELPQLINVLNGHMSLVGPRPHAIGSQAGNKLFWEVDSRYWERHALKPGLTGLAQIRGLRGATECEADLTGRLESDLEYLNGWSIWRDLWIIMATFRVLVHDRAF